MQGETLKQQILVFKSGSCWNSSARPGGYLPTRSLFSNRTVLLTF